MIYREGLGRPLSWAELDSNFKEVADTGTAAQAAASSARTNATIATTAQSAATASATSAGDSANTAKAEADRAKQIAGLDTVADAVGLCNAPFPDVWIPFSDSLRMIAGYGENIQVGGETVAVKASFSRASTATYIDKSGVLRTAAVNEPRFEHEGLLVEGQSTNLLLNSGTLTTQSVTVTDRSYTLSFYGSGSVTLSGAATGVLGGNGVSRVSLTVVAVAGVLVLTVSGTCTSAQLEALPFASSYIPTSGAAATRAADVVRVTDARNCKSTGLTISTECDSNITSGAATVNSFDFYNKISLTSTHFVSLVGSAGSYVSEPLPHNGSKAGVGIIRITDSDVVVGFNGVISRGRGLVYTPPTFDTFYIGSTSSGTRDFLFGHVRNFRIWHKALSDAQLKSLR